MDLAKVDDLLIAIFEMQEFNAQYFNARKGMILCYVSSEVIV